MKREFSAGGVLVRTVGGRPHVAAIRPQGKPAGTWVLPKGNIDAGESPAETARGEVREGAGGEGRPGANVAAYARWRLRPRVLLDVSEVSTATTLLGTPVSMPLGVAPFAMQRLIDADGEVATARGAAAVGALMCVSTLTSSTHAEIATAGKGPRWFQLYVLRDRQRTLDHITEAKEAGYSAVVLTVDLPD